MKRRRPWRMFRNYVDKTDQVMDSLAEQAAKDLGFKDEQILEVPTQELVSKTGYEAVVLQEIGILPQRFRDGFRLVASDLTAVNRRAFELFGIPVCVARREEIEAVWKEYCPENLLGQEQENLFKEYREYTARLKPRRNSTNAGRILLPVSGSS